MPIADIKIKFEFRVRRLSWAFVIELARWFGLCHPIVRIVYGILQPLAIRLPRRDWRVISHKTLLWSVYEKEK